MNSMSRSHFHNDNDPCPRPKIKDCKTILKCGSPGSAAIPAASTTPVTVSSLSLNTSCLCNPCIKLEFASTISVPAAAVATLTFQVFKLCNNQLTPVPVGPTWTFARLAALGTSDAFTFFVCDCDGCPNDCCTYTVVVTPSGVTVGVTINNATLSAIAVDSNCQCC